MRRKKFGKKVLNRHRPLPASALRQSYLRTRRNEERKEALSDLQDYDYDDCGCWNCYCHPWDAPDENPYVDYKLTELLSRILTPLNPLIGIESVTACFTGEAEPLLFENRRGDAASLEKRLAAHVQKLSGGWENTYALRRQIVESIGDRRNLQVLNRVADNNKIPEVVKLICFFSPFWIRSPLTWESESGVSLLDHIFVLYDAPEFLFAEWRNQAESGAPVLKWLCWFILLAQGGSLKRAAPLFNWSIPDRFQHYLQDAPADLPPTEACIFAEVRRLGGDETDFRRVRSYPTFLIDPTTGSEYNHGSAYWDEPAAVSADFWYETVRWLIANREAIRDGDSYMILSWAMHEYTETRNPYQTESFFWKGRSARAVIERSREYQNRLQRRSQQNYRWEGHGWDWTLDDANSNHWSFVELTSSEELFQESAVMNHCVATYDWRCVAGHSAIVSVKRNDAPCLTIEINPATKKAVQVKGPFNRAAYPEEQRMVDSWLNRVVSPKISNAEVGQD